MAVGHLEKTAETEKVLGLAIWSYPLAHIFRFWKKCIMTTPKAGIQFWKFKAAKIIEANYAGKYKAAFKLDHSPIHK